MNKFIRSLLVAALFLPFFIYINSSIAAPKSSISEAKNLIFVSGQRTGLMDVPDHNGKAIREALDKIRDIAQKNGATMDDVVKITVYFADPENDYPQLRGIVPEYFSHPFDLARSVVGVSRIPDGDNDNPFGLRRRVEIDAVIAVKAKHKSSR